MKKPHSVIDLVFFLLILITAFALVLSFIPVLRASGDENDASIGTVVGAFFFLLLEIALPLLVAEGSLWMACRYATRKTKTLLPSLLHAASTILSVTVIVILADLWLISPSIGGMNTLFLLIGPQLLLLLLQLFDRSLRSR